MKKQILMTLITSLFMSAAGTVFAAEAEDFSHEIKIDGSILTQWRSQRDTNGAPNRTRNGFKALFTLNADAPVNKNFDIYARMTYETLKHDWGTFMADYVNNTSQDNAAIDAYGIKYKNAGYTYTLGKQYLTFGQGLVYDDDGYVGNYTAPYALNVTGKVGITDISVMLVKTSYQDDVSNDKIYAVQGSYNINPKTNLGAMFAHASYGDSMVTSYSLPKKSVNYASIFGTYKLSPKANLSAEYSQATAKSDKKGFQTTLNYKLDKKNSLGLGYYYIEDQANILDYNIAGMTTGLSNNAEGYLISFKHKVNKNISFSVNDYNYKKINNVSRGGGAGSDRNRFYTKVIVSF